MKTLDKNNGIPADLMAELQQACDRVAKGIPFSKEERQEAARRIDRRREENAERLGIQNVAVDLVRESRDSR
jgi:hypothetical protein